MVRDKQHGPVIELNRIQVKRSRSKGGLAGPDGMKSVFGQMVNKMSLLNQESLFLPHRVWKVKFVGESVDDCGGGTESRREPVRPGSKRVSLCRLQREHCGDVRRAAERFPASPDSHAEREGRHGHKQRLLPAESERQDGASPADVQVFRFVPAAPE